LEGKERMRNEWAGNAERAVLISELSGTNSKLRTLNSELGEAADSELITQNHAP
jgi:hypothetical protein